MVLVAGAAPVVVRLGNDLSISRIDAAVGTAASGAWPCRGRSRSSLGCGLRRRRRLGPDGARSRHAMELTPAERADLDDDPGVEAALRPRRDAVVGARESGALMRGSGRRASGCPGPRQGGGPLAELCVLGDARIAAVLTASCASVMLWDAESGAELGRVVAAPGMRLRLAWSGADGLIAATVATGASWHISLAEPLPAPTDAEGWLVSSHRPRGMATRSSRSGPGRPLRLHGLQGRNRAGVGRPIR